jgi:hypothetical protein
MQLLLDTDVFTKLGCVDLLADLAVELKTTLKDCRRLPALLHMLKRGPLAKRLGPARCQHLLVLAEDVPTVAAPDPHWMDRLVHVPSIDPGEAQLLAVAAAADENVLLASGDKRALAAVSSVMGLAEALRGQVVTMESAVLLLCGTLGVQEVARRIAPALDLDKSLAICFRSTDPLVGLASYHNAIVSSTDPAIFYGLGGSVLT